MVLRKIMPLVHPRDTVSMSSVHSGVSGITSHNSMCIVCMWLCDVHVTMWCACVCMVYVYIFHSVTNFLVSVFWNKLWLEIVNEISRCITSGAPRFGRGILHPPSNVTCLHGRLPHPHVWTPGHSFHYLITTERGLTRQPPRDPIDAAWGQTIKLINWATPQLFHLPIERLLCFLPGFLIKFKKREVFFL